MKTYYKRDFPVGNVRRFLEPGPIVLVSSSWQGKSNIMTVGWHMIMEFEPSLVGCCIWTENHSFEMVRKSKACVINIPTVEIAETVVGNNRNQRRAARRRPRPESEVLRQSWISVVSAISMVPFDLQASEQDLHGARPLPAAASACQTSRIEPDARHQLLDKRAYCWVRQPTVVASLPITTDMGS